MLLNLLQLVGSYTFSTHSKQGWGIITDGTHLVISDGTEVLNFFEIPDQITMNGGELKKVYKHV